MSFIPSSSTFVCHLFSVACWGQGHGRLAMEGHREIVDVVVAAAARAQARARIKLLGGRCRQPRGMLPWHGRPKGELTAARPVQTRQPSRPAPLPIAARSSSIPPQHRYRPAIGPTCLAPQLVAYWSAGEPRPGLSRCAALSPALLPCSGMANCSKVEGSPFAGRPLLLQRLKTMA